MDLITGSRLHLDSSLDLAPEQHDNLLMNPVWTLGLSLSVSTKGRRSRGGGFVFSPSHGNNRRIRRIGTSTHRLISLFCASTHAPELDLDLDVHTVGTKPLGLGESLIFLDLDIFSG